MRRKNYKLGEVCVITIGKTPSRKNPKFWDEEKESENVWVSISDLSKLDNKLISDSEEYISDEGAKLFKPVKKGTLLMSFKLSIGKLAYAGKDLFTNEAIAAFNIIDEQILSKEFLFYYLSYFNWDFETQNDQKLLGKTLNKKKLQALPISIPPISAQKKIIENLDIVFAEIEKAVSATQKKEKELLQLKESILKNQFMKEK